MKAKALLIVIIALACQMQLTGLMAKDTATRPASEIAINPVFLATGTLSTEFETLVKPHWSVGANLWYEYSDVEARFAYLKLLYHPYHTNLKGFGIGASAGMITRYREKDKPNQKSSDTAPTLGAIAQYNWLLGKNDNWLLGIGFNLHAILKDYDGNSPLRRVDGDLRLMTGYAW